MVGLGNGVAVDLYFDGSRGWEDLYTFEGVFWVNVDGDVFLEPLICKSVSFLSSHESLQRHRGKVIASPHREFYVVKVQHAEFHELTHAPKLEANHPPKLTSSLPFLKSKHSITSHHFFRISNTTTPRNLNLHYCSKDGTSVILDRPLVLYLADLQLFY